MWKYKNQTLISVIGLAAGFTCFALATLWIRYEMTFDAFHKNAKQMYVVYSPSKGIFFNYNRVHFSRLSEYLKETFPEIADAITVFWSFLGDEAIVEGRKYPSSTILADTSIFRMFDVRVLEGSHEFLIGGSNKIAITQQKALRLFGDANPIGKTVHRGHIIMEEFTICAIVSDLPKRSNFAYDFISPPRGGGVTIIRLHPEINVKSFQQKLHDHEISEQGIANQNLIIKPITKIRYTDPDMRKEIKFQYIVFFSLCGLLIIFCALFNYLTLFASRFRIRQKELALRIVCGASGRSLWLMLSVEFLLTLLFSVVLGCMLTQWLHKPFLTMSGIQMDLSAVLLESLAYIGCIIVVAMSAFWLILLVFRHKSLNASIRRSNKNFSRKVSVVVQLVISIGFAFCSIVIIRQIHFLHHTDDLGFSFQNRGSVTIREASMNVHGVLENHLKQIPEIVEVFEASGMTDLFNIESLTNMKVSSWDDKPFDAEEITLEQFSVTSEYTNFYNFRLVAGEMLTDADPDNLVFINENAVKALGWHDPVGKSFRGSQHGSETYFTVKGVVKNIYNSTQTAEARPSVYSRGRAGTPMTIRNLGQVQVVCVALFQYRDGMWKSYAEKIEQMLKNEYPDLLDYEILNYEEEFDKILKSEGILSKLLSFASVICVLICVFGFVSLVSLTCEERRKEIAIRKINGATVDNILSMFAKEYFMLLIIGAVIAFSIGYYIMQRWLEYYVKQTSIPAWIYLSIVGVLALVIVLCVGWQVWRASIENPADVVKS